MITYKILVYIQKEASDSLNLTNEIIITWLEISFDDVASEASIQRIRDVLDDSAYVFITT